MRPIWRRSEIDAAKDYVLLLIEGDSGDREFEIREFEFKNKAVQGGRCAFMTEIIPINLVLAGDLLGIAENVKLIDGSSFGFDSNGRWYTAEEFENFKREVQRK